MPRVFRPAECTLEYSRPNRSETVNPRDSRLAGPHEYLWAIVRESARDKSSFRDRVLIFSVSTGISCIRGLLDPIRRFWHFRNALPRPRNVYCKILLPPPAPRPPTRNPAQQPRVYVTLRDALRYYTKQEQCVPQLQCSPLRCDLTSPFFPSPFHTDFFHYSHA